MVLPIFLNASPYSTPMMHLMFVRLFQVWICVTLHLGRGLTAYSWVTILLPVCCHPAYATAGSLLLCLTSDVPSFTAAPASALPRWMCPGCCCCTSAVCFSQRSGRGFLSSPVVSGGKIIASGQSLMKYTS